LNSFFCSFCSCDLFLFSFLFISFILPPCAEEHSFPQCLHVCPSLTSKHQCALLGQMLNNICIQRDIFLLQAGTCTLQLLITNKHTWHVLTDGEASLTLEEVLVLYVTALYVNCWHWMGQVFE
jgi:hypothetical protein